jgi:acetolactate decarboxylase
LRPQHDRTHRRRINPRRSGLLLLVGILIALAGCGQIPLTSSSSTSAAQDPETLTQVSTYPALQRGQFTGEVTYAQLAQVGDFGLGTFDGLDGEMIALDGVFYQAKADGSVRVADPSMTTPFADVSFFHGSQQLQLTTPLTNVEQLKGFLAQQLPSANRPYALKVSGTFPTLKFRSVPKQPLPYPQLTDAVAQQIVFEERNITGTLVGYTLPNYLSSVGLPGYHFHFISADRRRGGHVLDVSLTTATIDIDDLASVKLLIPQNATFQQTDFSQPQS